MTFDEWFDEYSKDMMVTGDIYPHCKATWEAARQAVRPEVEEKLTMQSALRSALGLWSGHCRECGGYNCHSVEPVRCSTMDKIAELERLAGIERVEHEQLPQNGKP